MAMQALVMGFGGTGAHILTALKELTVLKQGKMPDSIKFLLFDTIADWEPGKAVSIMGGAAEEKIAQGSEKATSLDRFTEYFYLSDHDPDLKKHVYEYLSREGNPEGYPHLKEWLHAAWLSEHIKEARLSITDGAAQQRQIGRFAMFQNSDRIIERVGGLIRSLADRAFNSSVNVWIIGSSAGGTGAGCFLDAAYIARLAAGNIDINLTGVIVLPNVYGGVDGISAARAYSLLREMDRVQEQGIPESDRFGDSSGSSATPTQISSQVQYDARKINTSRVKAKLFDDLFYLGQPCNREAMRRSFFTSVGNAIDPYLDSNSGPVLLEASVNQTAAASSFGAARLYVPVETFAEIFSWEQVEEYLKGATAPSEKAGLVVNVYSGKEKDRKDAGKNRVRNMLKLFDEILDKVDWAPDQKEKWARSDALDSEKVITGWYQFAGAAIADERLTPAEAQIIYLTYVNPFVSLIQPDVDKVEPQDRETKTYRENRDVKGVKESQEDSRDRFAAKLESIIGLYTNPGGGERTFEKGRQQVYEKVTARLNSRVDRLIIDEFTQNPAFASDQVDPEHGTTYTRLFEEVRYILSDDGPLKKIDATISKFIDTLNNEEATRVQQPVDALYALRRSKKTGFNPLSVWVEGYQQAAREECAEYVRWFQKRLLLRDMQQIVRAVITRFAAWERAMSKVLDSLVLREGESALFNIRRKHLSQLSDRLYRAARNPSALISFDPNPDVEMQGYRDQLRESVNTVGGGTLASNALSNSHWQANVRSDGTPELTLKVAGTATGTYTPDSIKNLAQDLHDYFHQEISRHLGSKDIFDYLLYVQGRHDIGPEQMANLLNGAASPLINAGGAIEECKLIYKEPTGNEKLGLAALIQAELKRANASTKDPERSYSDANSITVLKIKKPNLSEIVDLEECRSDYNRWQLEKLNGDTKHDTQLYRAQVYHPFRPELEAWFIERRHWLTKGEFPADSHLPPRIVRLLEHPEMFQAFVHCLATGAIEKIQGDWVWHAGGGRDLKLSDYDKEGQVDILRAAIVFCLQKREVGRSIQTITLADAKKSAVAYHQAQSKTLDEMLQVWKTGLDDFLRDNLYDGSNEKEVAALRIVLDFYADAGTRTGLQHRTKL